MWRTRIAQANPRDDFQRDMLFVAQGDTAAFLYVIAKLLEFRFGKLVHG
jgi:hypothetical protein